MKVAAKVRAKREMCATHLSVECAVKYNIAA